MRRDELMTSRVRGTRGGRGDTACIVGDRLTDMASEQTTMLRLVVVLRGGCVVYFYLYLVHRPVCFNVCFAFGERKEKKGPPTKFFRPKRIYRNMGHTHEHGAKALLVAKHAGIPWERDSP